MDERATGIENRREARVPLAGEVAVQFDATAIVGPGQNVSSQGVFFTAEGSLPVTVQIVSKGRTLRGELVRFERMGDGRVGIAVRFLEQDPDLVG